MTYIIRCFNNRKEIRYYKGYDDSTGEKLPIVITKYQYENGKDSPKHFVDLQKVLRRVEICKKKYRHCEIVKEY